VCVYIYIHTYIYIYKCTLPAWNIKTYYTKIVVRKELRHKILKPYECLACASKDDLAFVDVTFRDSVLVSHCLTLSHTDFKTAVILMGVEVFFDGLEPYVTELLIAKVV